MIECHPLLRPIVQLAKPVVHAVRTWHPSRHIVGVRHHVTHAVHRVHHVAAAAMPPPGVMTVCQRVAGPIIAGGLVLLPPASAVPPIGGIGGFPGTIVPEYGAPAFGGPAFVGPGGYGGGIAGFGSPYGLAGFSSGIIGPLSNNPASAGPLLANTAPASAAANQSTTTPELVSILSNTTAGTSTPETPISMNTVPSTSTTTGGNAPNTPDNGTPSGGSTPNNSNPGGPTTGTNNNGNPSTGDIPVVNTPEPASLALLAGFLLAAILVRSRYQNRI